MTDRQATDPWPTPGISPDGAMIYLLCGSSLSTTVYSDGRIQLLVGWPGWACLAYDDGWLAVLGPVYNPEARIMARAMDALGLTTDPPVREWLSARSAEDQDGCARVPPPASTGQRVRVTATRAPYDSP